MTMVIVVMIVIGTATPMLTPTAMIVTSEPIVNSVLKKQY